MLLNIKRTSDNKYNFINKQGDEILDKWYDATDTLNGDWNIIKDGDKFNLVNEQGDILSPIWFDDIDVSYCTNFRGVRLGDKLNLINNKGELISDIWLDTFPFIDKYKREFLKVDVNGLCVIYSQEHNKYGLYDFNRNRYTLNFEYDRITKFLEDYFEVGIYNHDKECIVYTFYHPKSGKFLSTFGEDIRYVGDGIFATKYNDQESITDCWGSIGIEADEIIDAYDGIILFKKNDKVGIANYDGEIILPHTYAYINSFYDRSITKANLSDGFISVIINKKGEPITPELKDVCFTICGYVITNLEGKKNFIDNTGNLLLDTWADHVWASFDYVLSTYSDRKYLSFLNGDSTIVCNDAQSIYCSNSGNCVLHTSNGKYRVYNNKGYLIASDVDEVDEFYSHLCVKKGEKYFVYSPSYDKILETNYKPVSTEYDDIKVRNEDDKENIIDLDTGELLFEKWYDYITALDYSTFEITEDEKSGVITREGDIIVPPKYEEISLQDECLIAENESELCIYDYEGNIIYKSDTYFVSHFVEDGVVLYDFNSDIIFNTKDKDLIIKEYKYIADTNPLIPKF